MRTTIDFRDDLMYEIQARASRDKTTLKDEINTCLKRALSLADAHKPAFRVRTHHMGGLAVEPGRVWGLVDSLEAEAYTSKRELGK